METKKINLEQITFTFLVDMISRIIRQEPSKESVRELITKTRPQFLESLNLLHSEKYECTIRDYSQLSAQFVMDTLTALGLIALDEPLVSYQVFRAYSIDIGMTMCSEAGMSFTCESN